MSGERIHQERARMPDLTHLMWPFFSDAHRDFAQGLNAWAQSGLP